MAEAKRKPQEHVESSASLEGLDQFFDAQSNNTSISPPATTIGDEYLRAQAEKLLDRFNDLLSFSVDQRVETAKIATQLIDNQRQLIATQQILIRLMERSLELTRHISSIEEKLPGLLEIPRVVESLRQRLAQLEGVETR